MTSDETVPVPVEFRWLVDDLGAIVVERGYWPEAFGNWAITFACDNFFLQVFCDRGDINVALRSRHGSTEWHSLDLVRNLLCDRPASEDASIAQLSQFARDHYARINELFAPSAMAVTEQRLGEFGKRRLHEMFPGSIAE